MFTTEQFKLEAKEYQKLSVIRDDIKEIVIESFVDIIEFEDHRTLFLYSEALKDLIESVVCENYKGVVHTVDIENEYSEKLLVTLNFVLDRCTREFQLDEYDFKSFIEEKEEEDAI